jgi:segregation and condensation protein B
MDYFGINSTDDLPKIREVLADQLIEGTMINPEDFTSNTSFEPKQEVISDIAVNEEGELIVKKDGETSTEENESEE